MALSVLNADIHVAGTLTANNMVIPGNAVGNSQFKTGDPLAVTKQVHRVYPALKQTHGGAAVAQREVVRIAHAAGTVSAVRAGVTVASTVDAEITVDVRKNGVSILASPLVLDSTDTAFTSALASISTASYSAGDFLEVVVTVDVAGGVLGQGLRVELVCDEAAT